jgi:hypothetical protein
MLQVKTKKYEKHKNKTYTHEELLIVHYFFSSTNEQVEEKKQGPQRGVHATLNPTIM